MVFAFFWMYATLILSQALFPIPLVAMDAASARREMAEVLNRINWMPFHYGYYTIGRAVFREVFFNFLITVPAGFILPALFRWKQRGVIIAFLISGLGIEILQLALSLWVRLAYRVVDISDVLLNAGGFLFGLGLFRLLNGWLRRDRKWNPASESEQTI